MTATVPAANVTTTAAWRVEERIQPGDRTFDVTGVPVTGSNADPYAGYETVDGFTSMGDRIETSDLEVLLDSYGIKHGPVKKVGRHANTHFSDGSQVFVKVVEPILLGSHSRSTLIEAMPEFRNRPTTDPAAANHAHALGLPVARPIKDIPVYLYIRASQRATLTLWEYLPGVEQVGWWSNTLIHAVAGFAGRMAGSEPHPGARPLNPSYRYEMGRHRLGTLAPGAHGTIVADTLRGERSREISERVRTQLDQAHESVIEVWERMDPTWGTGDLHLGNVLAVPSMPDGFAVIDFEYAGLLPLEAELSWMWSGIAGHPANRICHARVVREVTTRAVREFLNREARLDISAATAWLRSANRAALAIQHGQWDVAEAVLEGCEVLSRWTRALSGKL